MSLLSASMSRSASSPAPAAAAVAVSGGAAAALKFVRDVTRVFEMSEQLHHSARSSVHRARRRQDGLQGLRFVFVFF